MKKESDVNMQDYEWIRKLTPIEEVIDPDKETERELPILDEPMLDTMDKKVIIEAATTGWQPNRWWRERGEQVLPPGSRGGKTCIDEQVEAIVECVKAGASCIHTHPRRPQDGLPVESDAELYAEILDRAFDQEDFITMSSSFITDLRKGEAVDYVTYTQQLLDLGNGNRYAQASLIPTYGSHEEGRFCFTKEANTSGIIFFEENDIKPICSIEPYYFSQFKRYVFDKGIAKKPYLIALQMGKHGDDQQFADPWSYLQVVTNVGLVQSAIPFKDMTLGIHPGGRNWLPVSVIALLNGIQYIRLGIEDLFFLWPHRNDIPKTVSQSVKMIVDQCKILGREVATVEEAREIMGIKRTS